MMNYQATGRGPANINGGIHCSQCSHPFCIHTANPSINCNVNAFCDRSDPAPPGIASQYQNLNAFQQASPSSSASTLPTTSSSSSLSNESSNVQLSMTSNYEHNTAYQMRPSIPMPHQQHQHVRSCAAFNIPRASNPAPLYQPQPPAIPSEQIADLEQINDHQFESEKAQQETVATEQDIERVQMIMSIARLSLVAMQHCTANKAQIMSQMLGCNVLDTLYKAMFRYPHHAELQREIKETLSAFQKYLTQSVQTETSTEQSVPHCVDLTDSSSVDPSTKMESQRNAEKHAVTAAKARNRSNKFIRYLVQCNKYECTECGKQYKHVCNLRSHCKIHTEQAFCCEFCGKKFGRKSNWLEHTRIHTGERPFQCPVCKKGFRQKYSLKEHLKGHAHRIVS